MRLHRCASGNTKSYHGNAACQRRIIEGWNWGLKGSLSTNTCHMVLQMSAKNIIIISKILTVQHPFNLVFFKINYYCILSIIFLKVAFYQRKTATRFHPWSPVRLRKGHRSSLTRIVANCWCSPRTPTTNHRWPANKKDRWTSCRWYTV